MSTENSNDHFILKYRWEAGEEDFGIPVKISLSDKIETLQPTAQWQQLAIEGVDRDDIMIDQNQYFIKVVWE